MYQVFDYFTKVSIGRITGFEKPNIQRDMIKLYKKYPDLLPSIIQGKPIALPEMTLKELSKLFEREPKTRAYTGIINNLKDKYGITLTIKNIK